MDRDRLIRQMRQIVGGDGVIHERNQLRTYETDGLAAAPTRPTGWPPSG